LERRLEDEKSEYRHLLERIELFYARGLLDFGWGPIVFLDGAAYLLGLDLHLTKERLRELFQALEQKKKIIEILDEYLKASGPGPAVKVGLADAHPALEEFSLIGMQVPLATGMSARIAVLGPLRLNYPRTIAAVLEVGQALAPTPH
jgi:heat-inducible transcriptional repressor